MKRIGEWFRTRKGESGKAEGAPSDPRVTAGRLGLLAAAIGLVKALIELLSRK